MYTDLNLHSYLYTPSFQTGGDALSVPGRPHPLPREESGAHRRRATRRGRPLVTRQIAATATPRCLARQTDPVYIYIYIYRKIDTYIDA